MAIQVVKLTNSSRTTSATPRLTDNNFLEFERLFYQRMGSLTLNRKILDDYNEGKLPPEYINYLEQCNAILEFQTWGYTDAEITEGMKNLDLFFGTLGVSATYAYAKDTKSIPSWIIEEDASPIRPLVEYLEVLPLQSVNGHTYNNEDPDFILVDGDEYLAVYNI